MSTETIALVVFIITYIGIIFTRLPKVNIDRPSAAFVGAVAMMCLGIVDFSQAVSFIDFNTIFLLLGMMIVISALKADGLFNIVAQKTLAFANTRTKLLVCIVLISGIGSAFLVNDAVVLIFTPVIISICKRASLNPLPYLIAEILSSNVGSVMTITGNPQNMLIGLNSGISYADFMLHLLPVSLISMAITVVVIWFVYRKEFSLSTPLRYSEDTEPKQHGAYASSIIFVLLVAGFFLGKILQLPICVIALAAAALIILFSKHKPTELLKEVDWVLLLFFASLFVVVGAVQQTGVLDKVFSISISKDFSGLLSVHGISLVMSQILSNVPYTVLMLPIMNAVADQTLWLALASASTLAGNATIIGAMANIIVIESSERFGVKIGFWEFFKSGILVTLLSFGVSLLCLWLLQ